MMMHARSLDDGTLAERLKILARTEREATVALIVHLAEFDHRQLYRRAGFPSLFQYCVEVLRLSEDAASNRIAAARMSRRHPDVVNRLAAGSLSPTTVRLIAKHATSENARALIEAATGKTKRQVEQILARLFPQSEVPASIRPLGPPPSPSPLGLTTALSPLPLSPTHAAVAPQRPSAENVDSRAQLVEAPPRVAAGEDPLECFEIRFTAKGDTMAKLKMVQDLLSHALPNGDIAGVFDRALTALAEQLLSKQFSVTSAPRATPDSPSAADEPAAVKRAVYLRDRGRCTYVAEDGRRCESRRFLQFDHTQGKAVGGGFTVDNVRLRCGPHNRLEAERLYGTPPRARDAGGARMDLARVRPLWVEAPSVPGRIDRRESSKEREIRT